MNKVIDTRKEVAVLDIGTSKICCAVAKKETKGRSLDAFEDEKNIRILGVGYHLAKGIKKNTITNLEDLEESIVGTISTTEKDAQKSIKSLVVSLPSWATKSISIQSSMELGQLPVDDIHIGTLLNFDKSKYIDETREIIHIFPVAYSIDEATDIQDPIGMIGNKLSAVIHIITAPMALIKNIKNCLNRNNIEVEEFISSTYASGLSVLLNEEISSGVTLIDFGGTTTSIAFFKDGAFLHMETIPVGSQNITNDLAIILRTTQSHAERLKILYGVGNSDASNGNEEQCLVPRIDEYGEEHIQNISRSMLDSIIVSRLDEIVELIQNRIQKCGADMSVTQRIVITGGGSRLSGLNEFIKSNRYFSGSSVRLGKPICITGSHDFVKTSSFATCAGTVLYYLGMFFNSSFMRISNQKKSLKQKIITWFRRGI